MTIKKYKKEKIGIILCLLFFCEPFLSLSVPVFSYYDDIVVLLFLIYAVIFDEKIVKKSVFLLLVLGAFLLGMALFYNINYEIQSSKTAILLDAFNCSKFFIIAICGERYFKNVDADYVVLKIGRVFGVLTYFLLVLAILNLFFDFGMRDAARYGLPAFQFLCENAGQFNYCCYYIVAVLTAYYFVMPKKSVIPICAALILFASTLRARTFVFIGIYLFIFIYFTKANSINKIVVSIFSLATIPVFFLTSFSKFNYYFNNDNIARSRFVTDGVKVFKKYFPWGTGFATFGTSQAAIHYSPLYFEYGLDKVYGLYPDNPMFASDSFWPSIITQFGAIGTVIYIIMLLIVFNIFNKKFKNSRYKLSFYFILMIVLLSSTVTASFYHYTTIGMVLFVGIISSSRMEVNDGDFYANSNT